MNAFSEFRNVKVTFDNGIDAQGAMPIDAYKAVINKVQEIESKVASGATPADLADTTVVLTGTSKYAIYIFTVTTTVATGEYEFVFEEAAPNVEESTTLNQG